MAVGSHPVGAGLYARLRPITDDLVGELIDNSGHIIPLDRPEVLLELVESFLALPDRDGDEELQPKRSVSLRRR